jgi:O-methyltransferase/methyltransferase family protein
MSKPMEYIWPGIIAAQAIHAATKLDIADLLSSGPKSIAELVVDSGAHPPSLECLLRALSTLGVFAITPDGRFCNTPLSDLLRADRPDSQRASALFLPAAFLWRPLGELHETVRTGEPAFPRIFGQRFFEYLASHKDDAATFNAAMTEGIRWTSTGLLSAYDFSRFHLLVDVGGGEGALLRDILSATPGTRGVLFDLPQVVASASALLSGDVGARCQVIGGDFFNSVPEGGDAYLLKGVIHDWPDEDASKILRNTRRAMGPDGTLLLIENIVNRQRPVGIIELLMLVIGGRERTEEDFRSLLVATGFAITRIVAAEGTFVIECHLA